MAAPQAPLSGNVFTQTPLPASQGLSIITSPDTCKHELERSLFSEIREVGPQRLAPEASKNGWQGGN